VLQEIHMSRAKVRSSLLWFIDTRVNESVERRLAAVLAADVAGYSRLMGADELGTLTALKAGRWERLPR